MHKFLFSILGLFAAVSQLQAEDYPLPPVLDDKYSIPAPNPNTPWYDINN